MSTLDEEIKTLVTNLPSSLANAFKKANTPIPRPEKFSGANATPKSVRDFLESIDTYCEDKDFDLEEDDEECTQILRRFLKGDAKDEIRECLQNPKATYDEIKDQLRTAFGAIEDVVDLQSQLYSRVQAPGESLAQYSRNLSTLSNRILRVQKLKAPSTYAALVTSQDETLISRFCDGIRDPGVKQDCLRIQRQHRLDVSKAQKKLSFKAFRDEVLELYGKTDVNFASVYVNQMGVGVLSNRPSDVTQTQYVTRDEMLDMSQKMQDSITKQMQQLFKQPHPTPSENHSGSSYSRSEFRGNCFGCGQYGHTRRECPNSRGSGRNQRNQYQGRGRGQRPRQDYYEYTGHYQSYQHPDALPGYPPQMARVDPQYYSHVNVPGQQYSNMNYWSAQTNGPPLNPTAQTFPNPPHHGSELPTWQSYCPGVQQPSQNTGNSQSAQMAPPPFGNMHQTQTGGGSVGTGMLPPQNMPSNFFPPRHTAEPREES